MIEPQGSPESRVRTEVNAVGDLVLTDPRAMRALADPFRLELHDQLRRGGPITFDELAPLLDVKPEEIREHLEEMERVGLVERLEEEGPGETSWAALGKGFVFEIPADPKGQAAARELSRAMLRNYADLARRWVAEDESQLELEWARAAGLLSARMLVTADELREIQAAFERVLEPYLMRTQKKPPANAAQVRLLSFFMPEGG